MIKDLSSYDHSRTDFYPGLFSVLQKMNSWELLYEAVLALPRCSLKDKLIFYVEEGRRMAGQEALTRLQHIVVLLLPRLKKLRLGFDMQQSLCNLQCYLEQSCSHQAPGVM